MMALAPTRVLDIDCFCGGTGHWLKERFPGVETIGIECLAAAAARARPASSTIEQSKR